MDRSQNHEVFHMGQVLVLAVSFDLFFNAIEDSTNNRADFLGNILIPLFFTWCAIGGFVDVELLLKF